MYTYSLEIEHIFNVLPLNVWSFHRLSTGSPQKSKKISPTVQVPGQGTMYKSTLTSLLNENPNLSHDRLVRVRQRATQDVRPELLAEGISLYDDFALYKEKDSNDFLVGRLHRMRKKGQRSGYVEYRLPVKFDDPDLKNIETIFQVYSTVNTDTHKYLLDEKSPLHVCKASDVLCCLNLTYCQDDNTFTVPAEAVQLVTKAIQSRASTRSRQRGSAAQRSRVQEEMVFDGRFTRVVEPAAENTGLRRSTRKRTVVEYVL